MIEAFSLTGSSMSLTIISQLSHASQVSIANGFSLSEKIPQSFDIGLPSVNVNMSQITAKLQ